MRRIVVFLLILFMAVSIMPATADDASAASLEKAGKRMVKYAKLYKGSKYVRGGKHLRNLKKKNDINRTDCTGFVKGIYKRYANIKLPGGSHRKMLRKAMKYGDKIGSGTSAFKKARPGDIIFYNPGGWRQHVAIYYGKVDGKHMAIDCSRGKGGVSIHRVQKSPSAIVRLENKIAKNSKKYKKYKKKVLADRENKNDNIPDVVPKDPKETAEIDPKDIAPQDTTENVNPVE